RYLEVIVGACGKPLEQCRIFFSNCTDEQNRNRRCTRIALQPPAELHAIHARHNYIRDDDVQADRTRDLERPLCVVGDKYFVRLGLEQFTKQIKLYLIVVDDQHSCWIFGSVVHQESWPRAWRATKRIDERELLERVSLRKNR